MAGKSKSKSGFSISWHVIATRKGISALLPDASVVEHPIPPKWDDAAAWKKIRAAGVPDDGWAWDRTPAYGLQHVWGRPVRKSDVRQAFLDVKAGAGDWAEMDTRRATLLVKTSKMGCYSWNLPAGPPQHGGACPGSKAGFYLDAKGNDKSEAVAHALARSRSVVAKRFLESIPDAEHAVARFICNGCYALKGMYGTPTIMITQNWRMLWTEWAMNEGVFVESMMRTIEAGQVLAAKFRKLHGVGLDARVEMPHHEFFRIHDAGDFYDEAYLDAWLEICRKMPHVHFWAPTRVWADPEMAAVLERRVARNKIPRNLVIRPSGLFFDGSCPIIKGLAGGSTSSKITVEAVGDRIRVDIEAAPRDAWGCPAYLPDVIGGGAFPAIKPKPEDVAEVQENPVVAQTFAMYPPVDEASVASADAVFYDALMDRKTGRYIIETGKGRVKHGFGRPMRATKTNQNKHKGAVVVKAQKYQAAGACPVARDPHRDAECRVCWGVSKGQRDQSQAKQPIVYAKH